MKDLLQNLRKQALQISKDEFAGRVSPQQAAAQRRDLAASVSAEKVKKHTERIKQVTILQDCIRQKWEQKISITEPITAADFQKAAYTEEKKRRQLRLAGNDDLLKYLDEIRANPELYSQLPELTSLIMDEAKSRRSGKSEKSMQQIDFLQQVSALQSFMRSVNFDSYFKNSKEFQDLEKERVYLESTKDPDEIWIRNGDQIGLFRISDEVSYRPGIDELLRNAPRPASKIDELAGLVEPKGKPIAIGIGLTDEQAAAALEDALKKYRDQGIDTL